MSDVVLRVIVAAAVILVAVGIAAVVRRRRAADPPTQPVHRLPSQLDRADFDGEGWLLAVFTSDTCHTCDDVKRKAEAARSDTVAVQALSYQQRRDLHDRYRIDAVPTLLIVDGRGVVHRSFVGPVTATDLWAALADARQPGTTGDAGRR
jgi:exo-beta-1,3-glucanase (GH17 family)